MARRIARSVRLAQAIVLATRTFDPAELGGTFTAEVPKGLADPLAADPHPTLYVTPLGESAERERRQMTRRPQVQLLFTAPIDPSHRRDDWLGLVEAYLERLEVTKQAGMLFDAYEVQSLWDPEAARRGRFSALYTLTYLDVAIRGRG